jgi:hypothetical protein
MKALLEALQPHYSRITAAALPWLKKAGILLSLPRMLLTDTFSAPHISMHSQQFFLNG